MHKFMHNTWLFGPVARLKFLVLIGSLTLASCLSVGVGGKPGKDGASPAKDGQEQALSYPDFTKASDVGSIMEFLASDALKGRDTGTEGIEEAASFLETRLESYGVQPLFSSYRDTLGNINDVAFNVVGILPGSDPSLAGETLLIGAHYDHIGIVPLKNGDGIANGANDNASGSATVLELARYFGQAERPKRSLVFAFFSAEERGLLGSKHLAEKLAAEGISISGMLNFEMTGVPMMGKDYLVYLTGYHKSNMAELSNRYGGEDLVGYLPQAAEYNLFERSDNYAFYKISDIPAHTYSTFDFENYAYYHQPGDEVSEMDFEHMALICNRMIPVVNGLANATTSELKMN
jgi:hypothetical protein